MQVAGGTLPLHLLLCFSFASLVFILFGRLYFPLQTRAEE